MQGSLAHVIEGNMHTVSMFAVLALISMTSGANAADVYRWLDSDGKVVYSDRPPPANARNGELKKLGANAIEVDKQGFATRDAAKKNPLVLYANNCGTPCDSARQLLARRGVPFAAKNPESSPADAESLKQLVGALEVPVLLVGKTPVKGFETGAWEAALDAAGYPRHGAITGGAAVKPLEAPTQAIAPAPTPADKPVATATPRY